jgi:hypothetical protein
MCPGVVKGLGTGRGLYRVAVGSDSRRQSAVGRLALAGALLGGAHQSAYGLAYVDEGQSIPVFCREDGLVLRVLMQTPPPLFEPSFIVDTCAGLSGRGVH